MSNENKPDKIKTLYFPVVRQSNDYACGASALQAILYYYGLSYREDVLITELNTTPKDGTSPDAIIEFSRRLGFKVEAGEMTIDQIKKFINKKIPVLVNFQAWRDKDINWQTDYEDGHYAVIIGYELDNLIFGDPSLLNRGYIPTGEFLKRWHDVDQQGKKYKNLGIAIYGLKPQYDSRIIKRIH